MNNKFDSIQESTTLHSHATSLVFRVMQSLIELLKIKDSDQMALKTNLMMMSELNTDYFWQAGELEQADQEINVKIYEVGFSLVNNEKLMEVVYMGITR